MRFDVPRLRPLSVVKLKELWHSRCVDGRRSPSHEATPHRAGCRRDSRSQPIFSEPPSALRCSEYGMRNPRPTANDGLKEMLTAVSSLTPDVSSSSPVPFLKRTGPVAQNEPSEFSSEGARERIEHRRLPKSTVAAQSPKSKLSSEDLPRRRAFGSSRERRPVGSRSAKGQYRGDA